MLVQDCLFWDESTRLFILDFAAAVHGKVTAAAAHTSIGNEQGNTPHITGPNMITLNPKRQTVANPAATA